MKKTFIITFLIFCINTVFSQINEKQDIVLLFDSSNNIRYLEGISLFKIENHDFKYINSKHKKKHVFFNQISNSVVDIYQLNNKVKARLNKNGIKDNFIQSYYRKYFNLFVYVKNSICENEGTLYQVDWVLSINKPEKN